MCSCNLTEFQNYSSFKIYVDQATVYPSLQVVWVMSIKPFLSIFIQCFNYQDAIKINVTVGITEKRYFIYKIIYIN